MTFGQNMKNQNKYIAGDYWVYVSAKYNHKTTIIGDFFRKFSGKSARQEFRNSPGERRNIYYKYSAFRNNT